MLAASKVLVVTTTVLVGLILVALTTMLVAVSLEVEMIEAGSVATSPLIGVEVACVLFIVDSAFAVFVFVPLDVIGAGVSTPTRSVLVGDSVVIDEEVCCSMSVLVTDDITATSEVGDDISLVDPVGSTILDTAEPLLGDACASLVDDVDPSVDAMDVVTLEDSGSSDCCDSIPVSIAVVIDGACVDSSDCCDSMPVSIAVVTVNDSDTLVGCADMIKDGSSIEAVSPITSLGEVSA